MIREDRELLAELSRLNTDMTSLAMRVMDDSACTAEQAHYAQRLLPPVSGCRRCGCLRAWQLLWPSRLYDGTEPSEPRSAVFAKLGFLRSSLWFGGTHLPRSDAQARVNALRRLMTLTQKLDDHWLVCGDFNTPASSWLDSDRSVVVYRESAQPTYPADEPVEPIDYCVASPGFLMEGKVLPVGGSDHLPLVIFARLRGDV